MRFSIRLEESILDEIDSYTESKNKNRSDAIRSLIELGLRIENLKDCEEDSIDLSDERDKMLMEIWFGLIKTFTLTTNEVYKEDLSILSKKSKHLFQKIFWNVFKI